jgi:hypothetical protein
LVRGGAFVDMRPFFFGYAALLPGVLYVTVRRWRTVDLVPLCLMALWLALSLWHLRGVSDAVLITAPLVAEPGWRLIHLDDSYLMMVRQTSAQRVPVYTRIKSWEYPPVDRANATHVLAEAERALQTYPGEATFAWGYKAKALRALGRYQEALDAALNIPPEQFVFR